MEHGRADVCVMGAGPAGSTLAARLAQMGHDVWLVERARFPRRHLGESLSPGVLPLLESSGARTRVEAAGFPRVRTVSVDWDGGPQQRRDPAERGLLVDRGRFDRLLLSHARTLGVRVLQPAQVRERNPCEAGWRLVVETGSRSLELRASFLVDATGRSGALPARRRLTGCRTLALYAYWRGPVLPEQPRIEAGADAWYWGVPLPDHTYNTLIFIDGERLRAKPALPLERWFHELLNRSRLLAGCPGARLAGRVRAADATPYRDEESVTRRDLKVGDAALAIDPLSSSGVQKAVQTALAGSVVVNTLLRAPDRAEAAARFYRDAIARASDRHRAWAAGYYAAAAASRTGRFWRDRAAEAPAPPASPAPEGPSPLSPDRTLALSPQAELVELPCIEGELITVKRALCHPDLDGPVTFLGGWELAPLLSRLGSGATPLQMARTWSDQVPLESALAIAGWLTRHRILVPQLPAASWG